MPRTTTSATHNRFVGVTLRRRREAVGLTQAELAERLDVSAAYVQRVEAGGANLTVGQLARFADALGALLRVELQPLPEPDMVMSRLVRAADR